MNERRRWWRDSDGAPHEEIATFDGGQLVTVHNAAGQPEVGVDDPFDWPLRFDASLIDADTYYAETAQRKADAQVAACAALAAVRAAKIDALVAAGLDETVARILVEGGQP